MKFAIISDIHGNLSALNAVLSDIEGSSVNSIICLGDIVTLGPSPKEVLDKIIDLDCPCIMGNHELALFEPENCLEYDIQEHLKSSIYWCLDQLTENQIDFLRKSENSLVIPFDAENKMLCYHGSTRSSIEGIDNQTNDSILDELFGDLDSSIKCTVGGHVHFQMMRQYKQVNIVNTGSVGCAFQTPLEKGKPPSIIPYCQYALIESCNGNISVELKQIPYNISEFAKTVSLSELPLKEWWESEFIRLGI